MEFAGGLDMVYAGKRGAHTGEGKPVGGRLDGGSSEQRPGFFISILYDACLRITWEVCTMYILTRAGDSTGLTSATSDFVPSGLKRQPQFSPGPEAQRPRSPRPRGDSRPLVPGPAVDPLNLAAYHRCFPPPHSRIIYP